MTPDHPLLRAILADPDDDTRRLVAADWFADHDQHDRAEFVRLQVELARGVDDPARRAALEQRERELLSAHEAEWAAPLAAVLDVPPGLWTGWEFRRGFAEAFDLAAEAALARGRELARLTPVRELRLSPCSAEELAALAKHHWVRNLAHLHVPDTPITDAAARAVLYTPFLRDLRVIVYSRDAMTPGVREAFRERFAPPDESDLLPF
jgi:uncharacterized protein (TIGR02996 family)